MKVIKRTTETLDIVEDLLPLHDRQEGKMIFIVKEWLYVGEDLWLDDIQIVD